MSNITEFSTEDLQVDLADTLADIAMCHFALAFGIIEYSRGTVLRRLDENIAIFVMITDELKRREDRG